MPRPRRSIVRHAEMCRPDARWREWAEAQPIEVPPDLADRFAARRAGMAAGSALAETFTQAGGRGEDIRPVLFVLWRRGAAAREIRVCEFWDACSRSLHATLEGARLPRWYFEDTA